MTSDWTSRYYEAHQTRIYLALMLGLLGLGASVATIYAAPLEGVARLGCGIEALSCTKALSSIYSKFLGLPLGVWGVFYFAFWTLNLRAFQVTSNEGYLCFLSWITLAGVAGSLTLFTLMTFVLRAPCFYCLLTHFANIASFVVLWPVRKWRMSTPFTTEHFRHFAALTAVAALSALSLHLAERMRRLEARLANQERALKAAAALSGTESASFAQEVFANSSAPSTEQLITMRNMDEARQFALSQNRVLAVGFFHPQCFACEEFKDKVLSQSAFIRFSNTRLAWMAYDLEALRSLPEQDRQPVEVLMREHLVKETPTLLFLDAATGALLHKMEGYDLESSAETVVLNLASGLHQSRG